jgi:large subunit ribosomal protein L21
MYAIIRAGGKQTRVEEGDVFDVERLKTSGAVTFTPLLLVGDDGTVISDRSALAKAVVTAEVLGEHRGDKVEVFKYKSKSGYRRRQGHRQTYTTLQVTKIATSGGATKTAAAKKPAKETAAAESSAVDEPAKKTTAAKKPAAKKTTAAAKKPAAKKTTAAKKPAAKKPAAKKTTAAKKPAAKKTTAAKKPAAAKKKAAEPAPDDQEA